MTEKQPFFPYQEEFVQAKAEVQTACAVLEDKLNTYFNKEEQQFEVFYQTLVDDLARKRVLFQTKEEMLAYKTPVAEQ